MSPPSKRFSSEQAAKLELPEFTVADPESLAECLEHIDRCTVIGLDTEFIGEQTYIPDLCLIQVATPERLVLIDPLTCGPLDAFWQRIISTERITVVHAGREEIRLCRFASGKLPGNLFDIQIAAGLVGLGYPVGYANLIEDVLGHRVSKGQTLTNWRLRPLSTEQLRYAYDDVRFLLPLWRKLTGNLDALDRLGWMREEIDTLKHRAVVDNPVVEKWRKLKGVNSLDRKYLAVVREVYAWREEEAARFNRPSRSVLRDDLIVEIARRNPRTEKDVQALRGLGKVDVKGILGVVNRARALPADEWPAVFERENDSPQVNQVISLLSVILADLCSRKRITTSIAATTQDLRLLVRACAQNGDPPPESHLCRGWRKDHLLPDLMAILTGKRWLRIGDLKKDSPFKYRDES